MNYGHYEKNVKVSFNDIRLNNRLIAVLLQECKSQDRICVHFCLDFYILVDIMTKAVVGELCRI